MQLRRALAVLGLLAIAAVSGCSDAHSDSTADGSTTPAPTGSPSEAPPQDVTVAGGYVALGDSYTAAPGVPDTEQETGCFRSSGNYPSLVAAQLDGTTFEDVSCSGASTLSLVGAQQTAGKVLPAQFEALRPDTTLVTLQIGGNDLDLFQTLVGVCSQLGTGQPDGSPCRDQLQGSGADQLQENVRAIGERVTAAVQGVRDRSPHAQVVLVGYPQPVPAKGTCPELPLAAGDYPYVREVVTALGAAMDKAAKDGGATYVDMLAASAGHDICAGSDAWVNGIQSDMTRAIAFHPFAVEQQAVAERVLAAVKP
jgi:lysophospholipase L1-like esterase